MFPEGRAFEFLIAAVVAFVVFGPKELPAVMRKLGQFMAKARGMAAEFRASFDEMARQSELDELRKEVEAMRNAQLSDMAASAAIPEARAHFDAIHDGLSDVAVPYDPTAAFSHRETTIEAAPAVKRSRARKAAPVPATGKKAAKPKSASGPKAAAKTTSAKKAPAAKSRSRKPAGAGS
jgi:sec-independent protein translocase protein TatB